MLAPTNNGNGSSGIRKHRSIIIIYTIVEESSHGIAPNEPKQTEISRIKFNSPNLGQTLQSNVTVISRYII
jgi:hypothetical protein